MKIELNTLQISRALKFRIHTDGQIYGRLSNNEHEFYFAPEVLAILLYFAQQKDKKSQQSKMSLKDLTRHLNLYFNGIIKNLPKDRECAQIIQELLTSGILLTENIKLKHAQLDEGFSDPWIQWAMLADAKRSTSYERAIAEKVSNNSIVLDIGSGTGFLSACALHYGAKKVYAIEASSIAKDIQKLLQTMDLAQNLKTSFKLYHQNSFDVDLPDNINLIISELFGNDPFQENLYPTLQNIAPRIKHKKTVYIPHKLMVYGEIIDLKHHYAKERIQRYQSVSNESFYTQWLSSVKKELKFDSISYPLSMTAQDFERMSNSVLFGECPLDPPPVKAHEFAQCFSGEVKIPIIAKTFDTPIFIFWFRVFLTKEISLSSNPKETDYASHWSPIALPLNAKIHSKSDIRIKYHLSDENSLFECHVFDCDRLIGSRRFL